MNATLPSTRPISCLLDAYCPRPYRQKNYRYSLYDVALTDDEQRFRRDWFRRHWQQGVAFNQHVDISIRRWEPDGVEFFLPYADHLSAHNGIFHGGVVAAL